MLLFCIGLAACRTPSSRGLYLALGHTYFTAELEPVATALRPLGLKVLYPEVGVLDPQNLIFTDFSGTAMSPAVGDADAGDLLAAYVSRARTSFPGTTLIAWLYLNRAGGPGTESGVAGRGPGFRLEEATDRLALVRAVRRLKLAGFDGVQVDMEPFFESDVPPMVQLLDQIGREAGPPFIRSVFAPKFVSGPGDSGHPGYVWRSAAPYQRLARHCEQLVIPLYDYGPLARSDAAYRARVVAVRDELLPRLSPRSRIWLALPAYRQTPQHGTAERWQTALETLTGSSRPPGGIAFFQFTGDPVDFRPEELTPYSR